jgi:hypothetical protein
MLMMGSMRYLFRLIGPESWFCYAGGVERASCEPVFEPMLQYCNPVVRRVNTCSHFAISKYPAMGMNIKTTPLEQFSAALWPSRQLRSWRDGGRLAIAQNEVQTFSEASALTG